MKQSLCYVVDKLTKLETGFKLAHDVLSILIIQMEYQNLLRTLFVNELGFTLILFLNDCIKEANK